MKSRIILYPGSFNPVHNGHLAIAERVLELSGADAVWFIVSPCNPFKQGADLAPEQDRLEMVRLAIGTSRLRDRMAVSDTEFSMPHPTRTADTLKKLSELHPDHRFTLLIGSDNVDRFDQWKEYRYILDHYPVWVYPREGYLPRRKELLGQFHLLDKVDLMPQAASAIRREVGSGSAALCSREGEIPEPVWKYIKSHGLYERAK